MTRDCLTRLRAEARDAEIAAAWAARLAAKVRADESIKRLAALRKETNP